MIDFGGWASNWEWSGYSYAEPPAWSGVVITIPAIAGLCCVALSLAGAGGAGLWLFAAIGAALLIELVSRDGLDDKHILYVSYALSTVFAGALALVALRIAEDSLRVKFAVLAPCLVFALGPITSRAFAATLFSLRMVGVAKEHQALTRAALAGEGQGIVVRSERNDGDDVILTTVGEAAGQTLVATREVLDLEYPPHAGSHYFLAAPSFGDTEATGYRGESAQRRILGIKSFFFVGRKPESLRPSYYWDEVRAGIVFVLLEHSILFAIAWLAAHSIR